MRITGYPTEEAAAVFVDYAVATYSRGHLPALLDGMRRYSTWESDIPAVYGVSTAEFEASWQAYLLKDEG